VNDRDPADRGRSGSGLSEVACWCAACGRRHRVPIVAWRTEFHRARCVERRDRPATPRSPRRRDRKLPLRRDFPLAYVARSLCCRQLRSGLAVRRRRNQTGSRTNLIGVLDQRVMRVSQISAHPWYRSTNPELGVDTPPHRLGRRWVEDLVRARKQGPADPPGVALRSFDRPPSSVGPREALTHEGTKLPGAVIDLNGHAVAWVDEGRGAAPEDRAALRARSLHCPRRRAR
jgi:hypothetical protein